MENKTLPYWRIFPSEFFIKFIFWYEVNFTSFGLLAVHAVDYNYRDKVSFLYIYYLEIIAHYRYLVDVR